jgi:hypothetical protein
VVGMKYIKIAQELPCKVINRIIEILIKNGAIEGYLDKQTIFAMDLHHISELTNKFLKNLITLM